MVQVIFFSCDIFIESLPVAISNLMVSYFVLDNSDTLLLLLSNQQAGTDLIVLTNLAQRTFPFIFVSDASEKWNTIIFLILKMSFAENIMLSWILQTFWVCLSRSSIHLLIFFSYGLSQVMFSSENFDGSKPFSNEQCFDVWWIVNCNQNL